MKIDRSTYLNIKLGILYMRTLLFQMSGYGFYLGFYENSQVFKEEEGVLIATFMTRIFPKKSDNELL